MARINSIALKKTIAAQANRAIAPRMEPIIVRQFEQDKRKLETDFDKNPITKEIKAGSNANSSELSSGNLFSFLGFNMGEGSTVISNLKRLLIDGTKKIGRIKTVKNGNRIIYEMNVTVPTLSDIVSATEGWLDWTGRSFIQIIEKGAANFKKYLFDSSGRLSRYSRSGTAIQVKNNIRSESYSGTPYISQILSKFKNTILRNRK